jgi:P27 family predicted phage terminase small subunit
MASLTTFPGGSADVEEPDWDLLIRDRVEPIYTGRKNKKDTEYEYANPPKTKIISNKEWRAYAHREWLKVVKALKEAGILATENRHQIQRLVIAYVRYDMAAAELFTMGAIRKALRTGVPAHNPWQTELRMADQDATTAEMELGITPRRRNSVGKSKRKTPAQSKAAEYLASGTQD